MFGGIEQEQFYIDDAEDLVGRVGVNRDASMAFLLQTRNRFFIGQIIRQGEAIDARRHAIFRRFIAKFDDFFDHLGFFFLQRALLFADFKQRVQFFIG